MVVVGAVQSSVPRTGSACVSSKSSHRRALPVLRSSTNPSDHLTRRERSEVIREKCAGPIADPPSRGPKPSSARARRRSDLGWHALRAPRCGANESSVRSLLTSRAPRRSARSNHERAGARLPPGYRRLTSRSHASIGKNRAKSNLSFAVKTQTSCRTPGRFQFRGPRGGK